MNYSRAHNQKHHEIRMELYKIGFNDREIAEREHVRTNAISRWRKANNLIANGIKLYNRPEWADLLVELYDQGLSDKQIALESGLGVKTIAAWRRETDRRPNFAPIGGLNQYSSAR